MEKSLGNLLVSKKPIEIRGIDKFSLKCDCIVGSIANGIAESLLDIFAID